MPIPFELNDHSDLGTIFALDPASFDVPPTITHLHAALQEALVSSTPVPKLLTSCWTIIDTLCAFSSKIIGTVSSDDPRYWLVAQQCVTREQGYLGLEVICHRRLFTATGLDWTERERLLTISRKRLRSVLPILVDGIGLLLALETSAAKILENLWIMHNLIVQLRDVGLDLQSQTSVLSSEQSDTYVRLLFATLQCPSLTPSSVFSLLRGLRCLAFSDEPASRTVVELELLQRDGTIPPHIYKPTAAV